MALCLGPKIYTEDPIPGTESSLRTQKLAYLRNLEHVDELGRQKERGRINTQFIMQVSFEEYFKPFLDEVASTVVING